MSDTSPVPSAQTSPPPIEQHVMEGFTEAVSGLAISVSSFAEEYRLREEDRNQRLRDQEESRHRDRRIWTAGIVVILLFAIAAAVFALRLNVVASSNHENNKIVKDCVTPTGACFQRNQQNLAIAVQRANDGNDNGRIDTEEILQELHKIELAQAR